MRNLRINLLSGIISSSGVHQSKYSNCYNELKAIIELEKKEKDKDKIPKSFFEEFEEITGSINNLSERTEGVPLLILEQYFLRNSNDLKKYVYIEYDEVKIDMMTGDLYLILEEFYVKIYLLAVKIADFYNIDIKLKKERKEEDTYL